MLAKAITTLDKCRYHDKSSKVKQQKATRQAIYQEDIYTSGDASSIQYLTFEWTSDPGFAICSDLQLTLNVVKKWWKKTLFTIMGRTDDVNNLLNAIGFQFQNINYHNPWHHRLQIVMRKDHSCVRKQYKMVFKRWILVKSWTAGSPRSPKMCANRQLWSICNLN